MTLTEFLLARITEDEEAARSALSLHGSGTDWPLGHPLDPARVMTECAAKRRLVEEVGPRENMGHPADVTTDYYRRGLVSMWDSNLRTLGVIYSDHPDYDREWRP